MSAINAFNTGRLYTVSGQRIAWCVLSTGNVAMYDLDRMVDYVLIVHAPTDARVLAAYDGVSHSNPDNPKAPFNSAECHEAREMQSALINAARNAPTLAEWSLARQRSGL